MGLGTLINCAAIIAAGILGRIFSKILNKKVQKALVLSSGVSIFFIGLAGSMQGMLSISEGTLKSGRTMLLVISLAIGALIGEIIGIEEGFERFGAYLKKKTKSDSDQGFIAAFVTTSLTVSIGAMAIVGSMQEGIAGDYSTLALKAVLDFIVVFVMSASMGKGAIFSFVPVFILQMSITYLAKLIAPYMTDLAIDYLSLVGSVLIACIGINLLFDKRVSVANMLPALIVAMAAAYLPL